MILLCEEDTTIFWKWKNGLGQLLEYLYRILISKGDTTEFIFYLTAEIDCSAS